MPVTAALSKKFYEKFGEDVTNELVTWFNTVDATYRADLTQLNELNFSRFDAKLEQRLVELDAKWGQRWVELDAKLERRVAELRADMAVMKTDIIKWLFGFWAPTIVGLIAILLRG
jgi:hypothetical protein